MDEAIEIMQMMHDISEHKPLIVSVFGAGQDVGKSYFCKYAMEKLHKQYHHDITYSKEKLTLYIIEHYDTLEYLIMLSEINKPNPDRIDIQIWNKNIIGITKRFSDLNIFIYNSLMHNTNEEYVGLFFDIMIDNKNSENKKRF